MNHDYGVMIYEYGLFFLFPQLTFVMVSIPVVFPESSQNDAVLSSPTSGMDALPQWVMLQLEGDLINAQPGKPIGRIQPVPENMAHTNDLPSMFPHDSQVEFVLSGSHQRVAGKVKVTNGEETVRCVCRKRRDSEGNPYVEIIGKVATVIDFAGLRK